MLEKNYIHQENATPAGVELMWSGFVFACEPLMLIKEDSLMEIIWKNLRQIQRI